MSVIQTKSHEPQLDDVLRQMEAESPEAVRLREQSAFDAIAGPSSERLVLFGAGPLGKAVLSGLRKAGVEPLAFADNKQQLWGQEVSGIPVLSPTDAVRQYCATACFVVTIYQGSSVRRQLSSLGCSRVAPFAALMWKYASIFIPHSGIELPHNLLAECDAIRHCYSILADDASRRELCEQLRWRYWLDYSALSPPPDARNTYFPTDLLSPSGDDVFVDCGAFDGDSVLSFDQHWQGNFRHAFAFEPDPSNRAALSSNLKARNLEDRVTVMPYAVGNTNGPVSFTCTNSAASHLTGGIGEGNIECRRLQDVEWPVAPTYVKMDIEGAEPEALVGATGLLRQHHPVLAVCTYHRSEHLWQIANLIRSIAPEYNVFLRRYAEECWEGVCYAIPSSRLKQT